MEIRPLASGKVPVSMLGLAVAAGLFCVSCAPDGSRAAREVAPVCKDDVSQHAAELARAAAPDSLPSEVRRERRNGFIVAHRWELFDADRDGRINFEEYLNMEWAGYLAQLPAGGCIVTKRYFLMSFLGDPDGPNSFWKLPYALKTFTNIYDEIDKDKKGYITKDDLKDRAMGSFRYADRKSRGYLTHQELR